MNDIASSMGPAVEVFGHRVMRLFFLAGIVLTVALLLVSAGSATGSPPLLRLGLLGGMLLAWGLAYHRAGTVTNALRGAPSLILVLAATLVGVAGVDGGLLHSSLESEENILLGIAVVSGGFSSLLRTASLFSAGLLASLPFGDESRRLFTEPVLSDLVTLWGLTAVLATFLAVWHWVQQGALDERLAAVRDGAPALTPALGAAIRGDPVPPAPLLDELLQAAEIDVVKHLAAGCSAKAVAVIRQTSVHTVRNQISSAKRKTGARTIAELVAIAGGHRSESRDLAP